MIILRGPEIEEPRQCPYFSTRVSQYESMYACGLNDLEFDGLLEKGWRKFGVYFFRPRCPACRDCIPIRIQVEEFCPTKSQKRVLRKNAGITIQTVQLSYIQEVFDLYCDHLTRFSKASKPSRSEFQHAFLTPSVPGRQTLFYDGEKLAAAGFLDFSNQGLSSVYFVFDPVRTKSSLGTYGALVEIQMARKLRKKHYYLGYWIHDNTSMSYKNRFRPFEMLDWSTGTWSERS